MSIRHVAVALAVTAAWTEAPPIRLGAKTAADGPVPGSDGRGAGLRDRLAAERVKAHFLAR